MYHKIIPVIIAFPNVLVCFCYVPILLKFEEYSADFISVMFPLLEKLGAYLMLHSYYWMVPASNNYEVYLMPSLYHKIFLCQISVFKNIPVNVSIEIYLNVFSIILQYQIIVSPEIFWCQICFSDILSYQMSLFPALFRWMFLSKCSLHTLLPYNPLLTPLFDNCFHTSLLYK